MKQTSANPAQRKKGRKTARLQEVLFSLGIISSILYLITDIAASLMWREYSPVSQTVSELIAIDAPTRVYVAVSFILYALLIYAYGAGILLSSGGKRALKIAACLIIAKELLGLAATLFFPIHLRGIPADFSDTLHGILTAAGVFLCMFPAMIAGAVSFKGKSRAYSVITMILFVVFGLLAGLEQPKYALNLPTPLMGVWERINIYGYMLWIVIFSALLLKSSKVNKPSKGLSKRQ
ncbi:MAG: DUF998 domain-containing protein [Peptococcaceae bacterium]|nr:DUF998 domain-containing protein [Peptococcaceae bacterium]